MKTIILSIGLLLNLSVGLAVSAETVTYQVNPKDIHGGYITQKIWLSAYAMPDVTISGISYNTGVSLPKDAKAGDLGKIEIKLGMERKRPFAVIYIPAFSAG